MRQGKDLLEFISKILLSLVFGAMMIGLFIPKGQGLPIMIGAMMLFFIYPIIEGFLTLYHKWLYRNIIILEGWLTEGPNMWEWIQIHVINVVPLNKLPDKLHNAYMKNINKYYAQQIKDSTEKELEERFNKFVIDPKTLNVKPAKSIDYEKRKEFENKQVVPLGYLGEDEDEHEDEYYNILDTIKNDEDNENDIEPHGDENEND